MGLPVAVAPTVKTPGVWLSIDLTAGAASPGSAPKKGLIIAVKSASGTITADTQLVQSVSGEAAVSGYLGIGTLGHLAAKRLFEEYGLAQVDVCAPAVPAGVAASGTFTFASAPGPCAATHTVFAACAGRVVSVSWAAGETAIQGATKLAAALNALLSETPAVWANTGTAICTGTFRHAGLCGNDVKIRCWQVGNVAGDTVVASGANFISGTLEPNLTNVLGIIEGREYDVIVPCFSNAEMYTCLSTDNPGKLKTYMNQKIAGAGALLQQAVMGATGALASIKTGIGVLDHTLSECVYCMNGESLPSEWAGAEAGARLKAEGLDPAANRIGTPYIATLYGCASMAVDNPTDVEVEDALNTGITIVTYQADLTPRPSRPITCYHKDGSGNPDDRVLDTSRVTGCFAVAKDLRVNLPREFEGAKFSVDLPPGTQNAPKGVIEEKDVKAFVDGRIKFWIDGGVVRLDKYAAAVANGTFAVQQDPTDPAQCDIVLPLSIFPPLAKFSLVVKHFAS